MRLGDLDLELGSAVTVRDERVRPGDHEVHGKTSGLLDVPALRAQLVAAGFRLVTDQHAPATGACLLVGDRGAEILEVSFSGEPWNKLFVNLLDHDAMPALVVEGGTFTWGGRVWPAYFASAKVVSDAPDALILEAAAADALATLARYRAWACAQGFDLEQDLPDDLGFRGATFQAQLGVDGDRLTLFLTPFP